MLLEEGRAVQWAEQLSHDHLTSAHGSARKEQASLGGYCHGPLPCRATQLSAIPRISNDTSKGQSTGRRAGLGLREARGAFQEAPQDGAGPWLPAANLYQNTWGRALRALSQERGAGITRCQRQVCGRQEGETGYQKGLLGRNILHLDRGVPANRTQLFTRDACCLPRVNVGQQSRQR